MTRLFPLALLLSACVAPQERPCLSLDTQRDVGLVVGSSAILIGTTAAVDPMSARDTPGERRTRTGIELGLGFVALAGIVAVHKAGDRTCMPDSSAPSGAEGSP